MDMETGKSEIRWQTEVEEILRHALLDFEAMQADHLTAFESGKLQHVNLWRVQRDQAFMRICEIVTAVDQTPGQARDALLGSFSKTVARLLENERILAEKAVLLRDDLGRHLQQLRKGRTALHGYGMRYGMISQPRVVSNSV